MKGATMRGGLMAAVVVAGAQLFAGPAFALSFNVGKYPGAFDSDLTWGLSMRTQEPEPANQGAAYGNRTLFNDQWGIFSNVIKGSHTLSLGSDRFGVLMRGNWFVDFEMLNERLPEDAEDRAEFDGDLTDGYLYGSFGPEGQLSFRGGRQVISWGENTFIPGSLNDINTVNINKLRQPGADLKDAFIGTEAIYAAWTFVDNWTIEGFYLFAFDPIEIDPMGNFFTTLDAISDGGGFDSGGDGVNDKFAGPPREGALNRGNGACIPHDGIAPDGTVAFRCDLLGGNLVRARDEEPGFAGQGGVALRTFVPGLFQGAEFGLYYERLHDHLPMVSGFSGTGLFFVEYPDDIDRLGASFNTNVGGIAWSGEYSFRRNAPIQLTLPLLQSAPARGPFAAIPRPPIGAKVTGFDRIKRHQVQVTMNKNWGVWQLIGAEASVTLVEVMGGFLGDKPDVVAIPGAIPNLTNLFEPDISNEFGKLVGRHSFTYEAALFNLVALEPSLAFSWDFHGFSNELGGAKLVVEDRKAMTVALGFLYGGGRWTGAIAYTRFNGADTKVNNAGGRLNATNDRDFLSYNVSYSF